MTTEIRDRALSELGRGTILWPLYERAASGTACCAFSIIVDENVGTWQAPQINNSGDSGSTR